MKSKVVSDRHQYLKRKIDNEFVKEVIEKMRVGRSQIGEKTEKYRYRTEIEICRSELRGGIADRVEGKRIYSQFMGCTRRE